MLYHNNNTSQNKRYWSGQLKPSVTETKRPFALKDNMGHGYSYTGYGYCHPGMRNPPRYWAEPRSLESTDVRDPDTVADDVVIKITSLDMKIEENANQHNTYKFDMTDPDSDLAADDLRLVVRRGQSFDIGIDFNREFDKEKDDIRLVFEYGKTPKANNSTHIELILSDKDEPMSWGASIKRQEGNTLIIKVNTPPTLFVGRWTFNVDVIKKNEDDENNNTVFRKKLEKEIFILFNPWCPDDTVYMESSANRDEYVLNETGNIFKGNSSNPHPKAWNFGQFDPPVLRCVLELLEKHLKETYRGDPIFTVRKLSAVVNSEDENGILFGNWSGDYTGGSAPFAWDGSVKIIQQYYITKSPVKFGQCWVFSGVLTTVCRALGIPARSVTNFDSAHDTNGSVMIETYFKMDGSPDEWKNSDSVWNFHVWNDVWMKRPDIIQRYDGWQAIDATPQEQSHGYYQCGPMPLKAIKEGNVRLPYDGEFIFAEVNADRLYFKAQRDGTTKLFFRSRDSVGKKISTSKPGTETGERQDITDEYKYKDGSLQDKHSVVTALMMASGRTLVDEIELNNDLKITIDVADDIIIGADIEINVTVKNESSEEKAVEGKIHLNALTYTGQLFRPVKHENTSLNIAAGSSENLKMEVSYDEYNQKLTEQCLLEVFAIFKMPGTDKMWREEKKFDLNKPSLIINVPEEVEKGEVLTVDVSFTNPLPVKLTSCELNIESPTLNIPKIPKLSDLQANDVFQYSLEIKVIRRGIKNILGSFNAKELFEVIGTARCRVTEPSV